MLKDFSIGIEHFNPDELYEKVKQALDGVPWVGMYYLTYLENPETSTYYKHYNHSSLTELTFTAEENWIENSK